MSVAPSRPQILSLFRSLLRVAHNFPDYNIREYMKRRTIDAFRQNRNLSEPPSICSAFSDGKSQLDVAKRQAVVYSLYAPQLRSVMEIQNP
ncbi:hypothetical protein RIF29_28005 [Crotalaria pallida]|uniref:Complex 1 LYR protein domain-containing protein n=1 Tax=Crotalaria pallida TaxID=3830 RepID=A0AAN9ER36_CROPI